MHHIVLIGITGSGKTTVGKRVAEDLGLAYIGSGDIARELSESDRATELALQSGAMAPEQAMRAAVRTRLEQADLALGAWLLDGFPRTVAQLVCLMQWTAHLPTFIYLETEPWTAIERLVARGRPDDNPDAIARKLESFEVKTQPVLNTLEGGGILRAYNTDRWPLDDLVRMIEKEA